jgi:hypothetical protein
MRAIEEGSPSFYPVPIKETISEGGMSQTVPLESGFLTKIECDRFGAGEGHYSCGGTR